MVKDPQRDVDPTAEPPRIDPAPDPDDPGKERIPAGPIPQKPNEEPIGNGGTDAPAAFPPHD